MKGIVLPAFIIFVFIFAANSVYAQTYTYTFTKNGNTYVQTKTISGDKKIIETKIYDSAGNLIDTQTIEKTLEPAPTKSVVYPSKTLTATPKLTAIPTPSVTPTEIDSTIPLDVSTKSGNLTVGNKELYTEPQSAVNNAKSLGLDVVNNITVVEKDGRPKYVINGDKEEKLFALIKISLPASFVYDSETGQLEKIDQSFLVKVADALSI